MTLEPIQLVRLIFAALFVLTLLGGAYLVRHYERIFGPDREVAGENESSRAYSKVQVICLWIHAAGLTAAFALLLH